MKSPQLATHIRLPLKVLYKSFMYLKRPVFLRFLLMTGVTPSCDVETRSNIITVNTLSWTTAIVAVCGPAFIYFFMSPERWVLIPGVIEALACLLVVYLNKLKQYRAATVIFYFLQCGAILYFGMAFDRNAGVQQMAFFLGGLALLLFKRWSSRIACFFLTLVTLYLLEFNYNNRFFPPLAGEELPVRSIVFPVILLLNFMVILLYEYSKDQKRKEAERMNKLLGLYMQKLSHEAGNSLNLLWGAIQAYMPADGAEESHIPVEDMEAMYVTCADLKQLSSNLLSWSKIQSGVPDSVYKQPLVLKDWLYSMVDAYQMLARQHSIRVMPDIADDLPPAILTDVNKLSRIVNNLLSNALKFTDKRSVIKLSAGCENGRLFISVTDHGPGIADDMKERIFELYVSQQGQLQVATGLGLPIALHWARSLGGDITLQTTKGYGSTFTLTMPIEEAIIPEKRNNPQHYRPFDDFVVLVVDDNNMSIRIARLAMEPLGIKVIGAETAEQAYNRIEQYYPNAVLLDLNMPHIGGREILEQLKADRQTRHIPVIISSASHELPEIGKADGVLAKPFKFADLYQLLDKFRPRQVVA
ncbi:hypothetical protein CK934_11870 [Chitinophaga sp. MD30]|nr:hypothetical protein CK934_11870 [Chitinophaga sp. MD30]